MCAGDGKFIVLYSAFVSQLISLLRCVNWISLLLEETCRCLSALL